MLIVISGKDWMHFTKMIFLKLNKKAHAHVQTVTMEQPYHLNKAINLLLLLNPTCNTLFAVLSIKQEVISLLRCEAFWAHR